MSENITVLTTAPISKDDIELVSRMKRDEEMWLSEYRKTAESTFKFISTLTTGSVLLMGTFSTDLLKLEGTPLSHEFFTTNLPALLSALCLLVSLTTSALGMYSLTNFAKKGSSYFHGTVFNDPDSLREAYTKFLRRNASAINGFLISSISGFFLALSFMVWAALS